MPAVALFLSTFINKIDSKGRVSVPASFRSALTNQAFSGFIAYRAIKFPALEASSIEHLEDLTARIAALPELSDDRDALSSIMSDSHQLAFDSEGRIILPHFLAEYVGIAGSVAFVGLGRTFQIWEPERFKTHQEEMRERIRQRGLTVPTLQANASSNNGAPK